MIYQSIKDRMEKEKRDKKYKSFLDFKNRAIDHEQGEGFHKNIPEKGLQFFYSKYSFCLFKLIKVEGINTCYVYYMFADDEESFKSCYYAMINYCLGNNVKFIFYSEKQKNTFYKDFMIDLGYNFDEIYKIYAHDFICSKCKGNRLTCKCKTNNFYI